MQEVRRTGFVSLHVGNHKTIMFRHISGKQEVLLSLIGSIGSAARSDGFVLVNVSAILTRI